MGTRRWSLWLALVVVAGVLTLASSAPAQRDGVPFVPMYDGLGGPRQGLVWNAPGVRLVVESVAAGNAMVTVRTAETGLLGMGGRRWTALSAPVGAETVAVDGALLPDLRFVVRMRQRAPGCGTMCDDPLVMADMSRMPLYRAYLVMQWSGGGPAASQTWSSMTPGERPPPWVRQIDPHATR